MISAVIFDMDGILIDSEPFWQRAQVSIFGALGIELTARDTEGTIGLRIDDVVRYWYQRSPWTGTTLSQVQSDIVEEVIRLVQTEGGALPGVKESLTACLDMQLALGLATSSPHDLIDAVLDRIGAEKAFDVVCSAANEEFGKPHPAVYQTAARRLQVATHRCLVVEDSIFGVEAGKAAGMIVVAVPPAPLAADPGFDAADFKLDSLISLPKLINQMSA